MDAFTPAPQNTLQTDPDMRDLMDLVTKEIMLSLNCHAIATVESFDPATQTVDLTVNYSKTFYRKDPISGAYTPVQVDYPPLVKCPVYILGDGASCSLTFPIKAGATCSLLFHDRDISAWFASGQIGPLPSNAMHAFADAIALIGVRPLTNVIASYDTTRAVLQNGTTLVGVGPAKIKLANSNGTLNTLLQNLLTQLENLCTQIEALTVTCSGPGIASSPPINAAAFATISTQISSIGTQIGGLLE